jgi:hypothetical protein
VANTFLNLGATLWSSRAFLEFAASSIGAQVLDLTWVDGRNAEAVRIPRFLFDEDAIDDVGNLVDSPDVVSGDTLLLALDQHKGFFFQVPYNESEVSAAPLADAVLAQRVAALAFAVDVQAFSLVTGATYVLSGLVNKVTLVSAVQYLNEGNAPLSERLLVVSPAGYSDLLNSDDFTRADSIAGATVNADGRVGTVLGFEVFLSEALPAGVDAFAAHRTAVALAISRDLQSALFDEPRHFAIGGNGRARWGSQLMDPGRVVAITRS